MNRARKILEVSVHVFLLSFAIAPAFSQDLDRGYYVDNISLPAKFDHLIITTNGKHAVLTSQEGRDIGVVDLDNANITQSSIEVNGGPVSVTDVAIDPDGRTAFIVGIYKDQSSRGFIATLDLSSLRSRTLVFSDKFVRPCVTVNRYGIAYIGDINTSTLLRVDQSLFDLGSLSRSQTWEKNIYLKQGPAADIAASADGRYILVSHVNKKLISLVDTVEAATQDVFDASDKAISSDSSEISRQDGLLSRITPLSFVVAGENRRDTVALNSFPLIVGDAENRIIYALEHLPKYGSINSVSAFSIRGSQTDAALMSIKFPTSDAPLLLASNADRSVLAVSARKAAKISVYGGRGAMFQRLIDVPVAGGVRSIGMAGANTVVALEELGARLHVFRSGKIFSDRSMDFTQMFSKTKELQKGLLGLKIDPGATDGVFGQKTRRALEQFQRERGLAVTGTPDANTFTLIRDSTNSANTDRTDSIKK
jgi:hypothetical protein